MDKSSFYFFLTFIFAITLVGGWIPTVRIWSKSTFKLIISFCAGVLLGAVFFHILPESAPVLGDNLGYPVMVGFLLIFLMMKFIMVHPCEEGECDYHTVGLAAYIGIGIHSVLDGVAIGAGSLMNLSLVIIVAVTLHKFPAALALSSMLVKGGEYGRRKILWSMFIFSLATPLGAIFALAILKNMDDVLVATVLGVSAGTFLFISISDLLPAVYEEHQKGFKNLLSFCLGIFVMILSKGLI